MAPEPDIATARITLTYTWNGLSHKMRAPSRFSNPSTPASGLQTWAFAGVVAASVAAQALWDNVRETMQNDVSPATYILEQNFSGVFIPVDGGTLTGDGLQATDTTPAAQYTMTFKDTANQKLKLVEMEMMLAPPQKITDFVTPNINNALIRDVINPTANSSVGNWICSRDALQITRCVGAVVSLNKKLRRARGLS